MEFPVVCPKCGIRIPGGLNDTPLHLYEEHQIRVSHVVPDGFVCREIACKKWFSTYKGWQSHVKIHFSREKLGLGGSSSEAEVHLAENAISLATTYSLRSALPEKTTPLEDCHAVSGCHRGEASADGIGALEAHDTLCSQPEVSDISECNDVWFSGGHSHGTGEPEGRTHKGNHDFCEDFHYSRSADFVKRPLDGLTKYVSSNAEQPSAFCQKSHDTYEEEGYDFTWGEVQSGNDGNLDGNDARNGDDEGGCGGDDDGGGGGDDGGGDDGGGDDGGGDDGGGDGADDSGGGGADDGGGGGADEGGGGGDGGGDDGGGGGDDGGDDDDPGGGDRGNGDDDPSDGDGEDSEDEALNDQPGDIVESAAMLIAKLRNNCSVTRKQVSLTISLFDDLLATNNAVLGETVRRFLQRRHLNDEETQELLSTFEGNSPFQGMKSKEGQISAIKKYFRYVEPQTGYLGYRVEYGHINDGEFQQVPVRETFQYVSLIEVLKLVISKPGIREYMQNLRPRNDGTLHSYTDGQQYQDHPFFQAHPTAFQLMLYYDDYEVTKALGTKCNIHTIGAFYVQILNVPQEINSMLAGIHFVVLANVNDIKEHGFQTFLQHFTTDLLLLESDDGVRVFINGEVYILRGTLVAVTGDSKAVHELFGLLASGARHFCRVCMIDRPDFHNGAAFGEPRTRELHNQHLQRVAINRAYYETLTGVREDCCLHRSRYWHLTRNIVFDLLHDLGEGVIMVVIFLVLKHFISVEHYLRVCDLNRRISRFNYGRSDACNKPTANFCVENFDLHKKKLKQTGAQTFCLLRVLPFLLDGFPIPDDSPHLELLNLLRKVTDLSMAPRLAVDTLQYFRALLADFRELYRELFPDDDETNKFHHTLHNPDVAEEMGPPRQYMCFRQEGKHRLSKRHITTCNNYINPQKTAAENLQINQALAWGTDSETIEVQRIITGVSYDTVRRRRTSILLQAACGLHEDERVQTAKSMDHKGTRFSLGEFVVTRSADRNENGLLSFGKIVGIIVREEDKLWLEVEAWSTILYHERLCAYVIESRINGPVHLLDPNSLPLHPPLSLWRDYSTQRRYLSLKYFVL